jgi:hypothetical protein
VRLLRCVRTFAPIRKLVLNKNLKIISSTYFFDSTLIQKYSSWVRFSLLSQAEKGAALGISLVASEKEHRPALKGGYSEVSQTLFEQHYLVHCNKNNQPSLSEPFFPNKCGT